MNKIVILKKSFILLFFFFFFNQLIQSADILCVYPAPEGVSMNNDFTVRVRQKGKGWQNIPGYLIKVDEVRDSKHNVENSSMGYFDFSGEVEVSVTYNKGSIQTFRVHPLSYGIIPQVVGNTLTFKLNQPRNLSVEVNGDIFHNLQLFANPIDSFKPNLKDKILG